MVKSIIKLTAILLLLICLKSSSRIDIFDRVILTHNNIELQGTIARNINDFNETFTINYIGKENYEDIIDIIDMECNKAEKYYGVDIIHRVKIINYKERNEIQISVDYRQYHNKDEEMILRKKIDLILSDIIKPGMTDVQKVGAINYYIVRNTEYSEDMGDKQYSPYSVLVNGKGVCRGYALAIYRILNELGIETKYVTGKIISNDNTVLLHAWNLIKIDGDWYHLDVLWNDDKINTWEYASYKYFLVPDWAMSRSREWNTKLYPKADNNKYWYMRNIATAKDIDGILYYFDGGIRRINYDTGKSEFIIDKNIRDFDVYDDILYYVLGGKNSLVKYNINTKSNKVLVNEYVYSVEIEDKVLEYSYDYDYLLMALN